MTRDRPPRAHEREHNPRHSRLSVSGAGLAACAGLAALAGVAIPGPPARANALSARSGHVEGSASRGASTLLCRASIDPSTWPLPRLAASLLVVPVDAAAVSSATPEIAAGAGGLILTGSDAPRDLGASLATAGRKAPSSAPLVMTDEEGGAVQRLAGLVGSVPAARTMGATMTAGEVRALGRSLGLAMRRAGVTMDLAPVLDVDGGPGPNRADADGTRSFSGRQAIAADDGTAFASGLEQAGVLAVVKHFPGLGGSSGNTDLEAASTLPYSQLLRKGLPPFAQAFAAGVRAVMVANVTVPGLSTLPASLSPAVTTGLLRNRMGFRGLILTDSLSAISISAAGYGVANAAVAALKAGADLILYNAAPSTVASLTRSVVATIEGAVRSGELSRAQLSAAAEHVLEAKRFVACGR